ncbi:MAG: flagellar brake protein [Gammaproteobacteria bacterium]
MENAGHGRFRRRRRCRQISGQSRGRGLRQLPPQLPRRLTAVAARQLGKTNKSRLKRREKEEAPPVEENPLDALHRDYESGGDGQHLSITVAKGETDKAFTVQVTGVHGQSIIVAAPVQSDGSLVPLLAGQVLVCRTFQLTSAFRFTAVVLKTAFEPFPHLHLQLKKEVEHRQIRSAPRARVTVRAELHATGPLPCVVCDLSTGGARVALDIATFALEKGKSARLAMTVEVLQSKYVLELPVTVLNSMGPTDSRHPNVTFYGLKFDKLSEREGLALHGYVGEHLLREFHSLWQMLMAASDFGV